MKLPKSSSITTILIVLLITISCQTAQKQISHGLPLSNQWIISSFEEKDKIDLLKNSFITIDEKGNKFKGNGGCNTISGNVIVSGNKIKFEKITSTRMSCDNLKQENKFIKTLTQVTNFKIAGCELFLYNGNKKILTLESCR